MSSSPNAPQIPANADRASLSRAESYRWVVLGIAVTAQMTASMVSLGVYVLVPFWQSAYHLSQASAALAVSAMNVGQILVMVRLGLAIDRYGERRVVALTMVAMGLAALAALTLPVLAVKFGWPVAVCVAGGVGIAGGALFGIFYQDGIGQAANGAPSAPPSFRELIKMLAKVSALWPVLIAGAAMVSFQYAFFTHVLIFLTSRLEIPIVTAAFFFAFAQGVGIAGRVALAWISDRLWPGKRIRSLKWTMFACALSVVALMLLPAQSPDWLLATIFAALGLFGIGWYPLWLVEVAEMAPQTAVASTVGFAMTLNMIAITLMPPIFGLVVDSSNYQAAWTLLVAILVLGAVQLRGSATRTTV